MKKNIHRVFVVLGVAVAFLFCCVSVLLNRSAVWMLRTWNHLTVDELKYQLSNSIQGTDPGIIKGYIQFCMPSVILVFCLLLILVIEFIKRKKTLHITLWICVGLSVVIDIYSIYLVTDALDVKAYVQNRSESSDFIGDYYVDARDVEITFPQKKRNLIYIYLESMETTYTDVKDGGGFEENYIPELTKLAQEYEDFSGIEEKINGAIMMPNTTWTIAGMFAQTAGLPLDIPIQGLNMDTQEHFFPTIITLGDILDAQGYSQTLFIGSDSAFAGRELYFTEHGNYQMKDYYDAIAQNRIPSDYKVWWGYEDKKLFEYAKEELLELSKQEEPFNFTMLTADTHFEDGYVCDDCKEEFGENQYANVISCSSARVYEFVKWIQKQDFYDNTTIVISGDHLTMDSDFCDDIDQNCSRKVYTVYINLGVETERPEMKRKYMVFDQYPTTLASLGVSIAGNRLGLGTNLFSDEDTLVEMFGKDTIHAELSKSSVFMDKLNETIDMENKELLIREGKAISADMVIGEYDSMTGSIPITVSNIQNVEKGISAIDIAVWTENDQSDVQWISAYLLEDGSYYLDLYVSNFGYKTGEYYIDVYLVDQEGNQEILASTLGYVP